MQQKTTPFERHSHYWHIHTKTHDDAKWDAFVWDCKKIFECAPYLDKSLKLTGRGFKGSPIANEREVFFAGDPLHTIEPFRITKDVVPDILPFKPKGTVSLQYCQTDRFPYDAVVVAVLLTYKDHFGDGVTLVCDGRPEDLRKGKELRQRVLGK